MKFVFLFFFTVFLFACTEKTSFPPPGLGIKHLWILRDTLTGDTGRYWIASSIVVTRSEWDADSNRYFPTNHTPYHDLKKQAFYFKPIGKDNGTYMATDSISMLMRIPEQGSFWTQGAPDNHALRIGLVSESSPLLYFNRWEWDTRRFTCTRVYNDSAKVQYTVDAVLIKQP